MQQPVNSTPADCRLMRVETAAWESLRSHARTCSIAMLQPFEKAYVKHHADDNKRRENIGRKRMKHGSEAVISNAIR
jgi:hypothetical protein